MIRMMERVVDVTSGLEQSGRLGSGQRLQLWHCAIWTSFYLEQVVVQGEIFSRQSDPVSVFVAVAVVIVS